MSDLKYSYEKEKEYYSRDFPKKALPYSHLEPYLKCWLPGNLFEGKRVLDIGAGEGGYSRLIADKFNPKEVIAVELFYERLLPAIKENRNEKIKFVQGDAFNLHSQFEPESFDVVFGSLVLSQLPDLEKIVSEIKFVLKPGGYYIGIEPNPCNPVILYRFLRGRHSKNQYLLRPGHFKIFSGAGFSVSLSYFYAKYPFIKDRFLGTCIGVLAKNKKPEIETEVL